MPDKKDKAKKEEFIIRVDKFIYTKEDLNHIVGLDSKKSSLLLKNLLPSNKKMK
jgi:hypothetical protein